MLENVHLSGPKNKNTLIVPLLGVILLLLIPLLIVPQIQLLFEASRQIEEGKGRLQRLEEKKSQLSALESQGLRDNFLLAQAALPTTKDVGATLVSLDALAQKHRVTLVNFTTTDTADDTQVSKSAPALLITVTVEGAREDVKSFVEEIGSTLPLMSVKGIALIQDTAAISLASFYKPVVTSLPPADTSLVPFSEFQQTIATLSSFTRQTSFGEQVPSSVQEEEDQFPSAPTGRQNPFF